MENPILSSESLKREVIRIYEPFADFLGASTPESNFDISLLDVVHLSGHACPAITGAFVMVREAVKSLFPNNVCIRGDVRVDLPQAAQQGAAGPMANVFSYVTGAYGEAGFGGLQGKFARRSLLHFNSSEAPVNGVRFTRISTGKWVDVFYEPSKIQVDVGSEDPFQAVWRKKIAELIAHPYKYVRLVT